MTSGKQKQDQHEEEHEEHVPCWLQWTLALLIFTNIIAYFLVTWSTIKDLNKQIEVLKSRESSLSPDIAPTSTDWGLGKKIVGVSNRSGAVNNAERTLFTLGQAYQVDDILKVTFYHFEAS